MRDELIVELEEFEKLVNEYVNGLSEESYINQRLNDLRQNIFSKHGGKPPNNISTTLVALEKKIFLHKNTKTKPKFQFLNAVPKMRPVRVSAPLEMTAREKTFKISPEAVKIIAHNNENIVIANSQITSAPVTLEELDTCKIEILETVSTVYINKVSKCDILIGPCSGSVMIYEANQCTFKLVCKQLRVHDSNDIILLANTIIAPIIENCKNIRYNKYKFTYEGYKIQLETAKLENVEEIERHEITDFSWQKQTPSPNWNILE